MSGPTFNGTNSSGNTFTALTSWTLNVTGVLTNDTIVVCVINTTNANPTLVPTSIVDGQGSYVMQANAASTFNTGMSVWVLTGATAGTHALTITFASAVGGAVIWSTWSNSTGSFVDQGGAYFQGTSTTFSQALVNAQSNDTVLCHWFLNQAANTTTGTLFFNGGGIGVGCQAEYQTQSGSGSISVGCTTAISSFGPVAAISLQNNTSASLMGQACL